MEGKVDANLYSGSSWKLETDFFRLRRRLAKDSSSLTAGLLVEENSTDQGVSSPCRTTF